MRTLVIGGTGVISREIVRQLIDKKVETTVVNRGARSLTLPESVEQLKGDRSNRAEFAALFENRSFDVVIDMIAFTTEDARQTVELFGKRAGQLIIISSVAAYKRPLRSIPTLEEEIEFWETDEYYYGYQKALMENYLFEEIGKGLPITIVRPSLTFGDGARNVGVLRQNNGIIDRIRKGKPLVMFGDGTHAWSFTFTPDLARMIITLAGKKEAFGEAFQLASQDRNNWLDLYYEFGKIAGAEPRIVHVPSSLLYRRDPALFGHLIFEKSHPGLFSDAKYRRITGDDSGYIGLAEGLRDLAASWERDGLKPEPEKDRMEDEIISLLEDAYRRFETV